MPIIKHPLDQAMDPDEPGLYRQTMEVWDRGNVPLPDASAKAGKKVFGRFKLGFDLTPKKDKTEGSP